MFLKKSDFEIIIGTEVKGVNEEISALMAGFYFTVGDYCIPRENFIGCPNATLVWLLKATRLIDNGKYDERSILIYGSEYELVIRKLEKEELLLTFETKGKIVRKFKCKYLTILYKVLEGAEKSQKLLDKYEIQTMAELAIIDEIRLMKKHIKQKEAEKYIGLEES